MLRPPTNRRDGFLCALDARGARLFPVASRYVPLATGRRAVICPGFRSGRRFVSCRAAGGPAARPVLALRATARPVRGRGLLGAGVFLLIRSALPPRPRRGGGVGLVCGGRGVMAAVVLCLCRFRGSHLGAQALARRGEPDAAGAHGDGEQARHDGEHDDLALRRLALGFGARLELGGRDARPAHGRRARANGLLGRAGGIARVRPGERGGVLDLRALAVRKRR